MLPALFAALPSIHVFELPPGEQSTRRVGRQAHLALAHLSQEEEKGRQARPLHITMLVPMSVSMFGPTQVPSEGEERIYGVYNTDITYTFACVYI